MAKEVGKNTENANTEEERCFQRDKEKKKKKTDQLIKKNDGRRKNWLWSKNKNGFPKANKKTLSSPSMIKPSLRPLGKQKDFQPF